MRSRLLWRIIFLFIFLFSLGLFFYFSGTEDNLPKNLYEDSSNIILNPKSEFIKANFYDKKTGCKLSGSVEVNGLYMGNASDGEIVLRKINLNNSWNVKIKGMTDDCFGKNRGLPFVRFWDIEELDDKISFEADLDPRRPGYYEEMQGFIKPEEVKSEIETIRGELKGRIFLDIETIFNRYYLSYISDESNFNEHEFWQTPAESINNRGGDCEDWAIRFISLLRAYNSTISCYVALWDTHANVLCKIGDRINIYDQSKVNVGLNIENKDDEKYTQDNRIEIRRLLNSYFKEYGLGVNERRLYGLFNDKESIVFDNLSEFVDWAIK